MRNYLVVAAVLGGVIGASGRAEAWQWGHCGPYASSATFPCINPPGWYTNTYSYAWYYPWYAYYNYSHGPYANWMAGGGYAGYRSCDGRCGAIGLDGQPVMPQGHEPEKKEPDKKDAEPGKVLINLPEDARLLFNGTPAAGRGAVRTFATPPLAHGQSYAYDLTAEVIRDGRVQSVTERVVVRAGEKTSVTLSLNGIATAGLK